MISFKLPIQLANHLVFLHRLHSTKFQIQIAIRHPEALAEIFNTEQSLKTFFLLFSINQNYVPIITCKALVFNMTYVVP